MDTKEQTIQDTIEFVKNYNETTSINEVDQDILKLIWQDPKVDEYIRFKTLRIQAMKKGWNPDQLRHVQHKLVVLLMWEACQKKNFQVLNELERKHYTTKPIHYINSWLKEKVIDIYSYKYKHIQ